MSDVTESIADGRPAKPLGHKAYGSIPHLPGSRSGPADHFCHAGQAAICWTKARPGDRVIVTEKLDGSSVAVANIKGDIVALGRAGYLADTSPYEQHHRFARWVEDNEARFAAVLGPGERLCGEWLAQAHGTRYQLIHEPFVAFDLMRSSKRLPFDVLQAQASAGGFTTAAVLSDGPPCSLEAVIAMLEPSRHGAQEPVEGAVWRVERKGAFDFVAKWVRPDKIDGCLLPDVSGTGRIVWNWFPTQGALA